jgi:uncharacterized protein Smg (DUF494 family)
MKEGVLDILIYLFENYFDADTDDGFEPDRDTLKLELEKAGFPGAEVERALCWLEDLAADHPARLPLASSRHWSRRASIRTAAATSCTSSRSGSCRPCSASSSSTG